MKSNAQEICEFLGIRPAVLCSNPSELVDKMIKAVIDDDFMKVHSLAYNLKLEEG